MQHTKEIALAMERGANYVASRMARQRFREDLVDVQDVRQEAYLAFLQVATRYDPKAPGARMYFPTIGMRAAGPYVNRCLSAVSLSRAAAKKGLGRDLQVRVAYGDKPVKGREVAVLASAAPLQDEEIATRQSELRVRGALRRLRAKLLREVTRATSGMDEDEREAGAMVVGVGEPGMSARRVALETGMWRDDVDEAARKFRVAVRRRPQVARLSRLITALEARLR